MEKIIIGKIVKPQGIRGELKVLSLVDSPEIFNQLKSVYIDEKEYKIIATRLGDGVYLSLYGLADRNQAELLRNKDVYALKKDIPVENDRWFVADILNCTVYLVDGTLIGSVNDVSTRGSTDIFTVKTPLGKTVMFPFLKKMIISVDISAKKILIESDVFNEVALYED